MNSDCKTPIRLASRSPRRAAILRQLGIVFEIVVPEVEEIETGVDPASLVEVNALLKWRWCCERYPMSEIIAADTTVVLDAHAVGKPKDRAEACAMLRAASGRSHRVLTGYALGRDLGQGRPACTGVRESRVEFKSLCDAEIERYIDEVEPFDRAGAYDISAQGDWIVARYEGSLTNIMGLPAEVVEDWYENRGT